MSEQSLSHVRNSTIHIAHYSKQRKKFEDNLFYTGCILLLCFVAFPLLYAAAPFRVPIVEMLQGAQLKYILANCTANALVMLMALFSREVRLDDRLANVLSNTLVVHGALAFIVLIFRQPYSNLIMPLAVFISIVAGALFMYVQHCSTRLRIAVLGVCDSAIESAMTEDYEYVSDPRTDLRAYDILLTLNIVNLSSEWAGALSRAMLSGKRVRHLAEFNEERLGIVSIDHFELEHLPPGGLTAYRYRKYLLDIFLILITAPVTIPLTLLAMLAVLVTMGRPVFFIQKRAGLGGKPFRIYKFRTMRLQQTGSKSSTTSVNDTRITSLGRILRRYRIDELPQLCNVLNGHMSIIGPRPEWVVLSEKYGAALPVYAYRHLVRPGITGWAQVRGGYAGDLAETRAKVGYDLFYIKNMSFALDIQILVRTVWTLIIGHGAR